MGVFTMLPAPMLAPVRVMLTWALMYGPYWRSCDPVMDQPAAAVNFDAPLSHPPSSPACTSSTRSASCWMS